LGIRKFHGLLPFFILLFCTSSFYLILHYWGRSLLDINYERKFYLCEKIQENKELKIQIDQKGDHGALKDHEIGSGEP
jgi:hypothetical protein